MKTGREQLGKEAMRMSCLIEELPRCGKREELLNVLDELNVSFERFSDAFEGMVDFMRSNEELKEYEAYYDAVFDAITEAQDAVRKPPSVIAPPRKRIPSILPPLACKQEPEEPFACKQVPAAEEPFACKQAPAAEEPFACKQVPAIEPVSNEHPSASDDKCNMTDISGDVCMNECASMRDNQRESGNEESYGETHQMRQVCHSGSDRRYECVKVSVRNDDSPTYSGLKGKPCHIHAGNSYRTVTFKMHKKCRPRKATKYSATSSGKDTLPPSMSLRAMTVGKSTAALPSERSVTKLLVTLECKL